MTFEKIYITIYKKGLESSPFLYGTKGNILMHIIRRNHISIHLDAAEKVMKE